MTKSPTPTLPRSHQDLCNFIVDLATALQLNVRENYRLGRRIWGATRSIDIIISNPKNTQSLGIECKYQYHRGSIQDKILATLQDIDTWPINGLLIWYGPGFSQHFKAYLDSTGHALNLIDLPPWLHLYFNLFLDP